MAIKTQTTKNESSIIRLLIIGGALIALFSIWIWWAKIYNNPERIFWNTVSNNLNTHGFSKAMVQSDVSGSLQQQTQVSFGAENFARSITTITQDEGDDSQSEVVTEAIGTKEHNFVRYTKISTSQTTASGKQLDFSDIINVWGKQDLTGGGDSVFTEAVFGVVPFGLLSTEQRKELINFMKDNNVYTVDYTNLEHKTEDGREVIVYNVQVNAEAYIGLLQRFDEMLGLNQLAGVDPVNYAGSPPVNVALSIDKKARTLTRVLYVDSGREETFTGYGIRASLELPTDAITREELENNLNAVLIAE